MVSDSFHIFHNPRCSKSREGLALLRQHGIEPHIILYLKNPPSSSQLKKLLVLLEMTPRSLMRKREKLYREMQLDAPSLSDDELIDAMSANPKLIERPIITCGNSAILGRPPDNIALWLKDIKKS